MEKVDDKTLFKELMERVVESLTGQKVIVNVRKPISKSTQGHAYRTLDGCLMIDIDPGLDDKTFFHVFIHEIGHISCGHVYESTPGDYQNLPSDFFENLVSPQQWVEYIESPHELEADSFADQIGRYAVRLAEQTYSDASLENCLRALENVTIRKGE